MILIASSSYDKATWGPIVESLRSRNVDVLVCLTDEIAYGKVRLGFKLDRNGSIACRYGDRAFVASDIQAALYRRPDVFNMDEPDETKVIYMNRQREECLNSLWYSIAKERWLNAPQNMQPIANDKFVQMTLAQKAGFRIPKTITSNNWDEIMNFLPGQELILKMAYRLMYAQKRGYWLTSTIVKRDDRQKLARALPFPGIWQEYITKKREWRVTVVGEKVFAASIHTSEKARDDWRKHQLDSKKVTFKAGTLPESIAAKCVKFLKTMDLRFGAYDFIEDHQGNFFFLEVNTNGEYQWLVDQLGLEIPQAIVAELIRIAGLADKVK